MYLHSLRICFHLSLVAKHFFAHYIFVCTFIVSLQMFSIWWAVTSCYLLNVVSSWESCARCSWCAFLSRSFRRGSHTWIFWTFNRVQVRCASRSSLSRCVFSSSDIEQRIRERKSRTKIYASVIYLVYFIILHVFKSHKTSLWSFGKFLSGGF